MPNAPYTAYETEEGHFILENKKLKATFNSDGQLLQLIDKQTPSRYVFVYISTDEITYSFCM